MTRAGVSSSSESGAIEVPDNCAPDVKQSVDSRLISFDDPSDSNIAELREKTEC